MLLEAPSLVIENKFPPTALRKIIPSSFTLLVVTVNALVGELVFIPNLPLAASQNKLLLPVCVVVPLQYDTCPAVPVPVTGFVKTL